MKQVILALLGFGLSMSAFADSIATSTEADCISVLVSARALDLDPKVKDALNQMLSDETDFENQTAFAQKDQGDDKQQDLQAANSTSLDIIYQFNTNVSPNVIPALARNIANSCGIAQ